MPGFAHICITIGLSVFLFKITHGKFSIKHSIIFVVNCMVGPDIFGFLDYLDPLYLFLHGYGWFVAAIPLTLFWMVFAQYHLQWKPFKAWKADATKEPIITIPEIFCLVSAGGIFHMFIDIIGHPSYIWLNGVPNVPWGVTWFGDGNYFSIQDIWATGLFPCGNTFHFPEYLPVLISALGGALLLIMFVMQRSKKAFYLSSFLIIIGYFTPLAISWFIPNSGFNINQPGIVNYYGNPTGWVRFMFHLTGGESDLGTMIFFGLFLFVPLILLYYGYVGLPRVPKKGYRAIVEKIEKEEKQHTDEKILELLKAEQLQKEQKQRDAEKFQSILKSPGTP